MKSILLFLLFSIAFAQASDTKRMTDRQHDGFVAPVKKVFVEWSPIYRPRGNIPVGSRCRELTNLYDENGRLLQHSVYPGSCGSDEIREEYTYAQDGSTTAKTTEIRGENSPPPPPPAAGRPLTPEDRGQPRTVSKYDSSGKLIEHISIRPSGKVIYKTSYTYDATNRMIEMTGHDADNQVSSRRVYSYAGEDRVPSNFIYYGGDGKVYQRTSYTDYEFNSCGDWTKRTETTEETFNRKSVSLISRQIDYYSQKK